MKKFFIVKSNSAKRYRIKPKISVKKRTCKIKTPLNLKAF